jgi:His/Glu/Gln/Arg/opine family amino acid ABC transporter permease subunit
MAIMQQSLWTRGRRNCHAVHFLNINSMYLCSERINPITNWRLLIRMRAFNIHINKSTELKSQRERNDKVFDRRPRKTGNRAAASLGNESSRSCLRPRGPVSCPSFLKGDIAWQYVSANLFAPAVLSGVVNTIIMTFCAMGLGILLGVVAAMMRMSDNGVLRSISIGYIWLFRGIPALLQLLLWFNLALIFPTIGIPGLFSVKTVEIMTPFVAAFLGWESSRAPILPRL